MLDQDPTKQSRIPEIDRAVCIELLSLFQIEGEPADKMASEGQLEIFWLILFRPANRAQIICSTQYGKSLFVAFACIIVSCIQEEVISVVAPSSEKAKIIMRYYIEHLGDNVLFSDKLEQHTKLDRLQMEESKDRIMLRKNKDTGAQGGIFVVSANTGNSNKTLESAMGLGSKIVIGDEYGLVPDATEATIFRMIAGKGKDAFYCKIGNPFYSAKPYSHFYKTWIEDNNYYKLFIDYKQAIAEGRYSQQFIQEAEEKPNFDVLFACKFPDPDASDKDGWIPLLTDKEIEFAQDEAENVPHSGVKKLGVDCSEGKGRDESADVLRSMTVAEVIATSNTLDEMQHAGQVIREIEDLDLNPLNVAIDASGGGVISRCREQEKPVQGVNSGEGAVDSKRFLNKRAEGFWAVRTWIKNGGKLRPHKRWQDFRYIKYKTHSSGKIYIMSKDDMRAKGYPSPDTCDGLMHTFLIPDHVATKDQDSEIFFRAKMREKMKVAIKAGRSSKK